MMAWGIAPGCLSDAPCHHRARYADAPTFQLLKTSWIVRPNRLLGVPQITVAVYDDLYIVRLVDDALLEPFLDDIL